MPIQRKRNHQNGGFIFANNPINKKHGFISCRTSHFLFAEHARVALLNDVFKKIAVANSRSLVIVFLHVAVFAGFLPVSIGWRLFDANLHDKHVVEKLPFVTGSHGHEFVLLGTHDYHVLVPHSRQETVQPSFCLQLALVHKWQFFSVTSTLNLGIASENSSRPLRATCKCSVAR